MNVVHFEKKRCCKIVDFVPSYINQYRTGELHKKRDQLFKSLNAVIYVLENVELIEINMSEVVELEIL